jgi:hypothetical protein
MRKDKPVTERTRANCIHSYNVTTVDLDSGREQVGVTKGTPELNPAGASAGTRLWELHKPLPHTRLGLVGEGRNGTVVFDFERAAEKA